MAQRLIFYKAGLLALLAAGTASSAVSAQTMQTARPIGTVTLVLGKATVTPEQGPATELRPGATLMVGDRIETMQSGHVHIRFIDDALVSVRPASRLSINEYRYDPVKVKDSQVRFTLETGVARAISGAAAEGAKDRFRLNTPLVAIGVRGTDFVVSSHADQTTAQVNQGAIIMAPLGGNCQVNALGPCSTQTATFVSAQMGNVLAEYRDGLSLPEIKPSRQGSTTQFAAASETPPAPPRLAVTAKIEATAEASSIVALSDTSTLITHEPLPPPPPAPPPPVAPPPEPTPTPPAVLAWGHWAAPTGANDFSQPFRIAAVDREVTISDSRHILYRLPSAEGLTSIQPSLGTVGLQLAQASATFQPWSGAEQTAAVEGGSLTLNFASQQFQTQLRLNNATTGQQQLSATGNITQNGLFGSMGTGHKVLGATSLNGSDAGYLFEKTVNNGIFTGITTWSR